LVKVGEEVYAPWWNTLAVRKRTVTDAKWFPGKVKSFKDIDIDSPYGPTRFYDVAFDDGDEGTEIEDYWVWSKEDYLLNIHNDGEPSWKGVRNVLDSKAADKWPRIQGWYVAKIDRREQPFSRLSGERLKKLCSQSRLFMGLM
jgi:hypothetical protein